MALTAIPHLFTSFATVTQSVTDAVNEAANTLDDWMGEQETTALTTEAAQKRASRIKALVNNFYYRILIPIQDLAEHFHLSKAKVILVFTNFFSTIIQNINQIFQYFSLYSNFTNTISTTAFTTFFLFLGIVTSILGAGMAIYSAYKTAVLHRAIKAIPTVEENLSERITSISDIQKRTVHAQVKEILTLQRNRAFRNALLSLAGVVLFIVSNYVTFGAPMIAFLIVCLAFAIAKIIYDVKAHKKIQDLCQALNSHLLPIDQEWREDNALKAFNTFTSSTAPLLAHEAGYVFDPYAIKYLERQCRDSA